MTSMKRIISIILLAVTLTALWIEPYNATAATKTTTLTQKKVITLAQVKQPKLSSLGVATWTNVTNSKKYQVQLYRNGKVQGSPKTVTSGKTGYSFLSAMKSAGLGSYTVKVKAKGDGKSYTDGLLSKASVPQHIRALTQVSKPTWKMNTINWVADTNAKTYDIKLFKDEGLLETKTIPSGTTSYNFESIISKNLPGTFKVTIQTKGSGLHLDGAVSIPSLNNAGRAQLAQVEQPMLSALGDATWRDVTYAANYRGQLFRNGTTQGSPQTVASGERGYNFLAEMRAAGEGSYTMKVTAKGNGGFYTDGPESKASAEQVVTKAKTVMAVDLSSAGIATWTTTNGTTYDLKLYKDGVVVDIQESATSGYNYLSLMRSTGVGDYTVTVTAKSNIGLIINGDESKASAIQPVRSLIQVDQPTWTENNISWVANVYATTYEVKLFRDDVLLETHTIPLGTTTLDFETIISKNIPGTFKVTVQAKGSGLYLDSAVSVPSLNNAGRVPLAQVEQPLLSTLGIATWSNVANASNYQIQLYRDGSAQGSPQTVTSGETGYNFLSEMRVAGEGSYTVKVTAKGNGEFYTDGQNSKDTATQVVRALTKAAPPVWTANTISWIADANATNYIVKLFNRDNLISTKTIIADSTSFDFGNIIALNSPGIFTVTVQAEGSGLYLDGAASNLSNYNVQSVSLNQVGKPALSALGVATWPNVANATNYKVQLYLNGSAVGNAQTAINGDRGYNFFTTMRSTGTGSYTVKVTAIGDDLVYLDGLQSTASDVQVISKAMAVTNVNLSSTGIATWTTTNGTNYDLKLYKDSVTVDIQEEATSGYSYLSAMRDFGVGKYTITVSAKSDTGLIIDGDESEFSSAQTVASLTQLAQPTWTSDTITWSADVNTTNYEVRLYKGESVISTQTIPAGTTSLDFSQIITQNAPGEFKVTIQAKGSGLYIDGSVSTPSVSNLKTVKLSKVEKPTLAMTGFATWTNVENATKYQVQLYWYNSLVGEPKDVTNGETGYDFSSAIKANGSGSYTVKVTAKGEGLFYPGDESEASNQQVAGPVATFNGTAENTFEPVTSVDTNKDHIVITKVEPNTNLVAGVLTTFTVEVEYSLISADTAYLSINANWGNLSYNAMESTRHTVSKGCGKIRFVVSITPKNWGEGSPFWMISKLNKESDYTWLYNTQHLYLDVK